MPATDQIAHDLVSAVEADNGARPGSMLSRLKAEKRAELYKQLTDGVALMLNSGCMFTKDDVELMAMGDQDEAQERFSKFNGYAEANQALNNIFDPEREWVIRRSL